MHIHDRYAAVPWPLLAVLVSSIAVSAWALIVRKDSSDATPHLLMNGVMAAMLLDTSMSLGTWWLTITLATAGILAVRCAQAPNLTNAVHVGAASIMVAATATMLVGSAGSPLSALLTIVVIVDLAVTIALAATGRSGVTSDGRTPTVVTRVQALPHLGMGVGMLAMLAGV